MSVCKEELLHEFLEKHKNLPVQNSKQWLEDRKFFIGGSEMATVQGCNHFSGHRNLIENHLGLAQFKGNINTYWGSVLEDLTVQILEDRWHCKIHETGSLPGYIYEQKYSPDGLIYLDFFDQIILLEIKNPIKRVVTGRVPAQYKPQVFTGLDTIPIADRVLFIDSMFRRCSIHNFNFTNVYDSILHNNKKLDDPILIGAIYIYEDIYSTEYDMLKIKYGKSRNQFVDGGLCDIEDLEAVLLNTKDHKLIKKFSKMVVQEDDVTTNKNISQIFDNGDEIAVKNNYVPIMILPLKLFKFEIIPVERDEWRKKYNRSKKQWICEDTPYKCYVDSQSEDIKKIISQIKLLDPLTPSEQLKELDILYHTGPIFDDDYCNEVINTLM
jgi:hypothetical protein